MLHDPLLRSSSMDVDLFFAVWDLRACTEETGYFRYTRYDPSVVLEAGILSSEIMICVDQYIHMVDRGSVQCMLIFALHKYNESGGPEGCLRRNHSGH